MIAEARDAFGRELVEAAASCLAVENEACFLEHPQMLGYGRPADGHDLSEFMDGERASAEAVEDRHTGRITESVEAGLQVSVHLR